MSYINTETGEYPLYEIQIRAAHPQVSFSSTFTPPDGYAAVRDTLQPVYDPVTHACTPGTPVLLDGEWVSSWEVVALPPEVAAANLAALKAAKNRQINEWRAAANQTHFTYSGKQIACDALSRSDIDAVAGSIALTGAFPAGFPGAWKAMDNSYVVLANVEAFKAMYASMTAQGSINFGKSQALKAALDAATTAAQVAALVWE